MPHGASERAIKYQEQISALNNPRRPLPPGVAVSLTNPVTGARVAFDDCRESDGTMIEAKGPAFAKMLENAIMADSLAKQWVEQATSQLQASEGRPLEWYFAEEAAAVEAERIFANDKTLEGKIKVIHILALVQ
jgi:Restriction endonuclease fold toxin 5